MVTVAQGITSGAPSLHREAERISRELGPTRFIVAVPRTLEVDSPVDQVAVTGDAIMYPKDGARNTVPLIVMRADGRPAAVFAAGMWRWACDQDLMDGPTTSGGGE